MIKDKGIRALVPGVVTIQEEKEINDAREYIRRKLGVRNELQAAPTRRLVSDYLPSTISVKLPAETKNEFGYTPSEEKVIEKQMTKPKAPPGLWKNYIKASEKTDNKQEALAKALVESNKLAENETPAQTWNRLDGNEKRRQKQLMRSWGLDKEQQKQKDHYKKLVDFGIDNSSVKYTGSRQHLYDEWDKPEKKNPPKKSVNYLSNNYSFAENFKKNSKNINDLKSEVIIDPKHPDGFRLAADNDLYKNYGDTPIRYIQEIRYKYKDGPAPTDSIVKTFDGMDSSSFPADPNQKKALNKYQQVYNKLSPLQKKQLETAQKTKK